MSGVTDPAAGDERRARALQAVWESRIAAAAEPMVVVQQAAAGWLEGLIDYDLARTVIEQHSQRFMLQGDILRITVRMSGGQVTLDSKLNVFEGPPPS